MGQLNCALFLVQGTVCATTLVLLRCCLGGSTESGRDSLRNYLV
jgi:hypothetical protein